MLTPPSKRYGLVIVILLVVVIGFAATLFTQMGYLSIRVASVFTSLPDQSTSVADESIDPYTLTEADCLTSDDSPEDCLGLTEHEPDTTYAEVNADGTETILPTTPPTLEETCAAAKATYVIECGYVAPEDDYECRTAGAETVYQNCLAGQTDIIHNHGG